MEQNMDSVKEEAKRPEDMGEETEKELPGEETTTGGETDKYLRLTVEYENFRKRSQREKEAVYPDAVAATVEKFLQVVDNFERAMACETQDKEYKKGVDLIYSSLLDTLQKLQVEAYAQVGDSFEPELHNAVMHVEDENFGENVISAVFQKGYKIGERVIRHAMVQVAN